MQSYSLFPSLSKSGLNTNMSTSTLIESPQIQINPSKNSKKLKETVHFKEKRAFSEPKKRKNKPNFAGLKNANSSNLKKNLSLYEKNYNNLLTKSFLEKIYKVPIHIINNKEKILLATRYEEPKIILSCTYI